MSRLSDPDPPPELVTDASPAKRSVVPLYEGKIIRNRKRNPIHPDAIAELFYQRSKALGTTDPAHQEWKLILFVDDQTKHFVRLTGNYTKVCKDRADLLENGNYYKSWLILDKGER